MRTFIYCTYQHSLLDKTGVSKDKQSEREREKEGEKG